MAVKHSETGLWGFLTVFGLITSVDKIIDATQEHTGLAVVRACMYALVTTMSAVIWWLSWRKPSA